MSAIKIFLVTILLSSSSAFAANTQVRPESCHNCRAIVSLPYTQVESFRAILQLQSAMPLDLVALEVDRVYPFNAKVEVFTSPAYASNYHVTSFDIANKLMEMAQSPTLSSLSISDIQARVELP